MTKVHKFLYQCLIIGREKMFIKEMSTFNVVGHDGGELK